jgi:hypothetical protein
MRVVVMVMISVALVASSAIAAGAANTLEIVALSTRADKVSGGDVLVAVRVPVGTALDDVEVALNGADMTGTLSRDAGSHTLIGLITGMRIGQNRLEARATGAGTYKLELVNHPRTGPIFSGPQEKPFFCQTHQFRILPGGPFLTGAQIEDPCEVPNRVDYVYRSTEAIFKSFDPLAPRPADIATTRTGVPYVVRLETGTLNRAIYQTAILEDPTGQSGRQWNGKLVYAFGGGCGGGHYIQGAGTGGVLNDMALSRGFAVASASLNVLGTNCNDVLSAETMMMVKERFIESYGLPRYTLGWGCSGGGIQQYMIADNYPGLLDGLLPQCSFPDVYGTGTFDARLLLNYYAYKAAVPWEREELRAASGFGTFGQIYTQGTSWAARIDPSPTRPGFPPLIPDFPTTVNVSWLYNAIVPLEARYDPERNPTGARASTYDHNVNTFGRDEKGFARRPLDNVGIQYGLEALNEGAISKAQFLDLNEKIGGFDIDGNFTSERMVADRKATRAAYQTGKILNGGGGLASVPILDFDVIYTDLLAAGDVHMKYYHFSTRERIRRANGHSDNMVMWNGVFGPRAGTNVEAFLRMDEWLNNIAADTSDRPRAEKVVRNKPATLMDGCWKGGGAEPIEFIPEPQSLGGIGTSACNTLYPAYTFPRFVAGLSLANDVVACHLRPIALEDYAVEFTPEELERLQTIFPSGVCDWSRPGVEQHHGLLGTWLNYTDVGIYEKDPERF